MSDSCDTVGVCTRCVEVELDVEPFVVCKGCGKPWQLMSLKDAMFFFRDGLRAAPDRSMADALLAIALHGGHARFYEGVTTAWTGEHCGKVAQQALEEKL
jgi:hypothetical protein